ncbi:MAG: fibronectin-binding protein EfbA [Enterococcus sp.]
MSFDGVFTHLMVQELANKLIGGRLSKIHQPYPNEIVLVIRSQGQNQKLLLSAHPSYARIQLTQMQYANPETPPNFVMMLRKYLDGGILESIEQLENDRVIHLGFSKRNELGDLQKIVLVVELMGRHSTILLLNQANGKILDAIKHIGSSQNSYRSLLPGSEYIEPPQQTGLNPFTASTTEVFTRLSQASEITPRYLQSTFQGLGFDTASELAFRLNQQPNEKIPVWEQFFTQLTTTLTPSLIENQQKSWFTPLRFASLVGDESQVQTADTLSQLLDLFYLGKAEKDRAKQQGNELLKKVANELARNQKKLQKRQQTLADSENAETFRQKGELLTTFMNQVPRGANEVELANYYDENQLLKISLNPALTPNQNAQKYFQRYQKLKNAVKLVHQQIEETKAEIAYLETVESQLELATPLDIGLIREELIDQGYLKRKTTKKQKQPTPSKPEQFFSLDGTTILVGKNNLQNDQLTLKTARKTDYWLHAKNIPGSHVIIRAQDPSEATILQAAELAAYYSKYRLSAQVPVDLVQVKYLKKPNGAKPGYVIYENQTTLYITPSEANIQQMKQQKPEAY